MSCLYPTLVLNPKYKPSKKNGGNPPIPKDPRTLYIPIPCGNCRECKKKNANNWNVRLTEHIKEHKNGKFVLLTISDEHYLKLNEDINPAYKGYDRDNKIAILAKQRFEDRLRKATNKKLECWLVTELGPNNTERLHIHGIIWTDESKETITRLWKYGYTGRGRTWREAGNYVNGESVGYITKYLFKTDLKHPNYKPIILCSNGIGKGYTKTVQFRENQFNGEKTRDYYRTSNGYKVGLPSYYRQKIYTDEEREKLWSQTLDKETRYIGSQKFNTSTKEGKLIYLESLKQAQKDSKQLGYGSSQKNWDQMQYEQQLRELRLKKLTKRQHENMIFRATRAFKA